MTTLQIEHAISDISTWRSAFDRFAEMRLRSGVLRESVRRPIDDEKYVVVELDFADRTSAREFLRFLETTVWSTPANSPALVGSPHARLVESA